MCYYLEEYSDYFKRNYEETKIIEAELESYRTKVEINQLIPEKETTTVFGVDLDEIVNREKGYVPHIIQNCITFLYETGAIECIGLFRISGSGSTIDIIKQKIDSGERIDFYSYNFNNPHIVAGILKLYLRTLPNPLMTYALFEDFISITTIVPESKAIDKCIDIVHSLPHSYRICLDYVINFCRVVSSNSTYNKMNAKNLSSLIAPNILKRENPNPMKMLEDINHANRVVEILIDNYWDIFIGINYNQSLLKVSLPDQKKIIPFSELFSKVSFVEELPDEEHEDEERGRIRKKDSHKREVAIDDKPKKKQDSELYKKDNSTTSGPVVSIIVNNNTEENLKIYLKRKGSRAKSVDPYKSITLIGKNNTNNELRHGSIDNKRFVSKSRTRKNDFSLKKKKRRKSRQELLA